MKWIKTAFIIYISLTMAASLNLSANKPAEELVSINKDIWKEKTSDIDYTETFKEMEPRERKERKAKSPITFGKSFWKILIILIVFILGVLIISILTNKNFNPFDRRIRNTNQPGAMSEHIEDNIHELDLNKLMDVARAEGNYKLVIRLYYLQIVKLLSERKLIKWKREKTNNQYIREMNKSDAGEIFLALTRKYEQVWFSDISFSNDDFLVTEPYYKSFIEKIPAVETI